MPAISYYLGRPARLWISVMSGTAQASEANPAAATCLASPRTAAPEAPSTPAVTAARTSPLQAGGSGWRTCPVVCWHTMSCVCTRCLEHDLFAVEVYRSLPAWWQILPVGGNDTSA
jgi:hypothetical protein